MAGQSRVAFGLELEEKVVIASALLAMHAGLEPADAAEANEIFGAIFVKLDLAAALVAIRDSATPGR